jgi:L-rhamnose-proton symport protein (RhaT)
LRAILSHSNELRVDTRFAACLPFGRHGWLHDCADEICQPLEMGKRLVSVLLRCPVSRAGADHDDKVPECRERLRKPELFEPGNGGLPRVRLGNRLRTRGHRIRHARRWSRDDTEFGSNYCVWIAASVRSPISRAAPKPPAIALYVAILLVVIGLALSARAGTVRERAQNTAKNVAVADLATFARGNLRKGLVICIAAGLFSSMYNLALSFGQGIRLAALSAGARPADAVNALWLPVEIAAFSANFGYCGYLLSKNSTWALYVAPRSFGHWMLAVLMGLLWVSSISVYGLGAAHLGTMGPILGFPVNMAMTIIAANVAGIITGEWAGSPRRALLFLRSGALVLIAAMVVIGVWQANSR